MVDYIKLNELKKIVKYTLNEKTESCPVGQAKNPFDNKCYSIASLPDGLEPSAEEMYPDASPDVDTGELPADTSIATNVGLMFGKLISDDVLDDEAIECSLWSGGLGVSTGVISQGLLGVVKQSMKAGFGVLSRGRASAELSSDVADSALKKAANEASPDIVEKAVKLLTSGKLAAIGILVAGIGTGAYFITKAAKVTGTNFEAFNFWSKFSEEFLNDIKQIPKNYCFWTGLALTFAVSRRSRKFFTGTLKKMGNNAYDLTKSILPNAINNGFRAIPEEKILEEAPDLAKFLFLRRVNQLIGRRESAVLKVVVNDGGTKLSLENDIIFEAIPRPMFDTLDDAVKDNLISIFGDSITTRGFRIKIKASEVNSGLDKLLAKGGALDTEITQAADAAVKASRKTPSMRALDAISDSFIEGTGIIDRMKLVNKLGADIGNTTDDLIQSLGSTLGNLKETSAKLKISEEAFDKVFEGGGKKVFQDFIEKNINQGADSVRDISRDTIKDIISEFGKNRFTTEQLEKAAEDYINDFFNLTLQRNSAAKGIEFFNSVSNTQITQMSELLGPNAIDDLLSAPGVRNSIRKNATEVLQNAAAHFALDGKSELVKNLGLYAGLALGAQFIFQLKDDDEFRKVYQLINREDHVERLVNYGSGPMTLFDEVATMWTKENYKKLNDLVLGSGENSSKDASKVGRLVLDSFENYVNGFEFTFTLKDPQDDKTYNNEEIKKIFSLYFKAIKDSQFKVDNKSAFQWIGEYFTEGSNKISRGQGPSIWKEDKKLVIGKITAVLRHFFEPFVSYMQNPTNFQANAGKANINKTKPTPTPTDGEQKDSIGLIKQIPENKRSNLVNAGPVSIKGPGGKTFQLRFTDEHMFIDNNKFGFTALGLNATFTKVEIKNDKAIAHMKAGIGPFTKKDKKIFDDALLLKMLKSLNRNGSFETESEGGRSVKIEKIKENKEMDKKDLKKLVNEVLNETSGIGYSPSHYYETEQKPQEEDMEVDYKNMLSDFDNDPGIDTAVKVAKCLVVNKEIMRELLELAMSVPDLRSEIVDRLKEMK